MIPVHCLTRHNPPDTYGDCVRACIASMLELPATDVPHFYRDGCDAETGTQRMREYLATLGYCAFYVAYDGGSSLDELQRVMMQINPGITYMLFGSTEDCDHIVICRDGITLHDPAWVRVPIIGPSSNGFWGIMVLVKM